MAEREGFEPSEEITFFAGLANLWFKPLTHLSCNVNISRYQFSLKKFNKDNQYK